MRVLAKPAAFTPASPEEILRPVNPWVIVLTFLLGTWPISRRLRVWCSR